MQGASSPHCVSLVIVITSVLLLMTSSLSAATIHVPADFPTIQQAIDAATDGDEILVAPGTYSETIDLVGKTLTLRSSEGPEKTRIDAAGIGGSVITITSGVGPETLIDGFTITGGSGTPLDAEGYDLAGGGLYMVGAILTISNCHFRGNVVLAGSRAWGGGIYALGSALTISNSVFEDNRVSSGDVSSGGAIYTNSSAIVTNCLFRENRAFGDLEGRGGAIAGGAILTQCVFEGNRASAGHCGWAFGGAISGGVVINECIFDGNRASVFDDCAAAFGGAISGSATASNSHFLGNSATALTIDPSKGGNVARGGAIYGSGTYTDCAFDGNYAHATGAWTTITGGAIHALSLPELAESTFCQNAPNHITGDWQDDGDNVLATHADLDCDGVVDVFDLLTLLAEWGECEDDVNCKADLDDNGVVDVFDLLILLGNWG